MYHGRLVYLPKIQAQDLSALLPFDPERPVPCCLVSEGYSMDDSPSWNRWLLSHHCSFLVWSLCINALKLEQYEQAERYLNVYNEVLTYTRIISPADYAAHVRPMMAAFWPGFSAVWSFDFQQLKTLIKALPKTTSLAPLHQAFKSCHYNHLETAKALVPQGRSLLQEIKKAGQQQPSTSETLHFVYDSLFLIRRQSMTQSQLEWQVLAKFVALLADNQTQQGELMTHTPAMVQWLQTRWVL
jgi:hypothetical protein